MAKKKNKDYSKTVRAAGNKKDRKKKIHDMVEALINGDTDTAVDSLHAYMAEKSREIVLGEEHDEEEDDTSEDDENQDDEENGDSEDKDKDDDDSEESDEDDEKEDDDSEEDEDDEKEEKKNKKEDDS